jgi:hemerythrin superfamily protein
MDVVLQQSLSVAHDVASKQGKMAEKKFVRTLTSDVIKEPKDWADEGYLIPHEPIRWDLIEAERVLQEKYFNGLVPWKVDNFYKWYDIFYGIVHHHHDNEELIFFPALAAKASVPDRLSADHKGLMQMMDDIKTSRAAFTAATTDAEKKAAATKLRTLFTTFAKEMKQHLAEEERVITPLLRQHMTHQEHDAIINKMLEKAGFSENKKMIPWVMRSLKLWMTPQEVDTFYLVIPAPIRWLNDYAWTYAYERDNWGLLHSLEQDKPRESSFWDYIL